MGLPPDEYESIPNECGSTPEEIHENWGFTPQRIPYFFYPGPNEILNIYNLPLRNFIGPQLGGWRAILN